MFYIFFFSSIKTIFQEKEKSFKHWWGGPRGVMVKAVDSRIIVSELVLRSHYYAHFWANNLVKGMNPLILPAIG